jgi:hypothetical protein
MKLNDVFESKPLSVHEVISESGTCFHIPEYQRPYSWNKDKVIRLICDIKAGCSVLVKHEDAITFLGTLLTVDDYKGVSLSPELKAEKPSKTRLVIDGQQRLTTLTLLCTRLYLRLENYLNLITELTYKVESKNESLEFVEQLNKFADSLHNISAGLRFFSKDTNSRDKYNRYYPLLTRAEDDVWSKQKNTAKYTSAIAEYIFKVNKLAVDNKFDVYPNASDPTVDANLNVIDEQLSKIADGYIFTEDNIQNIHNINFENYKQETFFDIDRLPQLINLNEDISDKDIKIISEAIYLSVFSSYLLYRTCFTFVSVNNLDYAFDMFEALNTTGEPLTAYETFRPKAIQYFHKLKEKDIHDKEQKGREYLNIIDGYLNSISNATEKNDATKKLIDTFSYALTGKIAGTHISQQRRFLIDSFSVSKDKLSYLLQLANTAEFLFSVWYDQKDNVIAACIDPLDQKQEFKLSISILKATGHEIARPLLAVAYHDFKSSNDNEKLKQVVKMLAAYWVLRRAGTGGTAGIDSRYKELYSGSNLHDIKITFGYGILSNLDKLSCYFKKDLAHTFIDKNSEFDAVETKDKWISKAAKIQQYKSGKQLGICRILLLASMQDIEIKFDSNSNCYWKTIKSKLNSHTTLTYYNWMEFIKSGDGQLTIEHIAPQNPKKYDWDSSLDDKELTNTLGNLVILSRGDNSEASNQSWINKQALYKELASKEDIGTDRNYNKFIKTVSSSPAWIADIVKSRSECLLNNSWDNLIKWLLL